MTVRTPIDWDELEAVFDWNDPERHAFLDRTTGELLVWSEFDPEEVSDLEDRVDAEPARYARIEPPGARQEWGWMADFADEVDDPRMQELLWVALRGRGAFRRFRDVLTSDPALRERWFEWRAERMRQALQGWLEEEGVVPAVPAPWGLSSCG